MVSNTLPWATQVAWWVKTSTIATTLLLAALSVLLVFFVMRLQRRQALRSGLRWVSRLLGVMGVALIALLSYDYFSGTNGVSGEFQKWLINYSYSVQSSRPYLFGDILLENRGRGMMLGVALCCCWALPFIAGLFRLRPTANCCAKCGYSLEKLPSNESGDVTCPECGNKSR